MNNVRRFSMGIEKRNDYFDIVKGIGILSIVIGHSCWNVSLGRFELPIGPFVYLYHLAIFFFCSGYFFKEADSLSTLLVKRVKSLYLPFVAWNSAYVLIRNVFLWLGILEGSPYTGGEYVIVLTNGLLFSGVGEFLAAFWFLPVLFIAILLFAVCVKIANRFAASPFILAAEIALFGILGLYTMQHRFGMLYSMQISYLAVPILYMGWVYRRLEKKVSRYFGWASMALCLLVLCGILAANIGCIELSDFRIIHPLVFYPVTLVGIVFCLSLGGILSGTAVGKAVSYCGRKSISIMAMHIVGIKLVDLLYNLLVEPLDNLSAFPYATRKLWFVYCIAGVLFSLAADLGIERVKRSLSKALRKASSN